MLCMWLLHKRHLAALALSACLIHVSCTKKSADTDVSATLSPIEKGKRVYMANCIACHNVNPQLDGAIGPANWGSSRELIYAKVIQNKYPEGYQPKRKSSAMAPLPHLEKDIDDLHAFLNAK